jgi:hypothetical protein
MSRIFLLVSVVPSRKMRLYTPNARDVPTKKGHIHSGCSSYPRSVHRFFLPSASADHRQAEYPPLGCGAAACRPEYPIGFQSAPGYSGGKAGGQILRNPHPGNHRRIHEFHRRGGLIRSVMFFLLLIAGISAALFHVPSPVMVRDVSGHRVGTGMSYFMVGGEMARTLGPILATAAVSWWGLEGIFRLIPLGLLATLVLFIGLRNYKHPETAGREKSGRQGLNILKRYWAFLLFAFDGHPV